MICPLRLERTGPALHKPIGGGGSSLMRKMKSKDSLLRIGRRADTSSPMGYPS